MSKAVISKVRIIAMVALMALATTATAAFAGTATLSWSPPATNLDGSPISSLSGYKVHYGTASGSYSQTADAGTATSKTLSNLTDGSTYYFVVTAYNSSGVEGPQSSEVSKAMQVADVTGPVVSGVYADTVTSSSAVIHWSTNENASSQVEYGTTTSYGYTNPVNGTMTGTHTETIAGLAPSTLYNYRVKSSDASGNETVSSNFTFTTAAPADTIAPVISDVMATNITSTSATITWKTNEPSTTQVDYGAGSYTDSSALDTTLVTIHSVDISGLSGFTLHNFRVRSSDAASNSAVSGDNTFTTSNTVPSVSSFAAASTSGNAPLSVNFTAAGTDTDGFISLYEWDLDGDGSYEQNTGSTGRATHTYNGAGTYNARVRVTDNGGAAAVSEPIAMTITTPSNQPPTVESFTATAVQGGTKGSFRFDITASDPNGSIVSYEWDFDGNGTIDATTDTAPATYTYTAVGTYTATVTVTDGNGATAKGQTAVTVTEAASGSGVSPSSPSDSPVTAGACFIASAAYGSYLEPEVQVLRDFRDNSLLTNPVGKAFVKLYYNTSPPMADFISRHEGVRFIARVALTPLVYGVKHPQATLALTLTLTAGFILYRRRKV